MELLIKAGGIYSLGFAIFHVFFWKLFNWGRDLRKLSPVNRAIMQIMNLCLILVFAMMAYVSFFHAKEMTESSIGRTLLFFFALFWLARTVEQFIFLRISSWIVHALSAVFAAGTMIYAAAFAGVLYGI